VQLRVLSTSVYHLADNLIREQVVRLFVLDQEHRNFDDLPLEYESISDRLAEAELNLFIIPPAPGFAL
jgi:hypothetical protein